MGVLRSEYDLEKRIDEVWYESTNVIYSKFVEDESENSGDLYVVFKGGKQYLYKSVSYLNYLSFKRGVVDGSSGKALNQYIIKVYPAEKVDDMDVNELTARLNSPTEKELTYFVHGDGDVDEEVFQIEYARAIEYALNASSDCRFAVEFTNKYGMRCVEHLVGTCGIDPKRITVYMQESDYVDLDERYRDCKVVKIRDVDYTESFIEREIMERSFEDIGYVSDEQLKEISKTSRTAYIILKRRMG